MKNYNNNSGHIPFRENFSDGFQALPPRKALSSQVKSLIWLTLEMFPWALLCLGSVCKFLKVPGKNNVFFDIHKKKVDKLKAPLFLGKNNYFKFDGRQYRAITIADETRPAITGSSVQGKGTITGDSRIRLGLGLNERIAPKLFNCECKVSVTLKGE